MAYRKTRRRCGVVAGGEMVLEGRRSSCIGGGGGKVVLMGRRRRSYVRGGKGREVGLWCIIIMSMNI